MWRSARQRPQTSPKHRVGRHITDCATERHLCGGPHNWRESIGVQAEIAIARELGKPVTFLRVNGQAEENPGLAGVRRREEDGLSRCG